MVALARHACSHSPVAIANARSGDARRREERSRRRGARQELRGQRDACRGCYARRLDATTVPYSRDARLMAAESGTDLYRAAYQVILECLVENRARTEVARD